MDKPNYILDIGIKYGIASWFDSWFETKVNYWASLKSFQLIHNTWTWDGRSWQGRRRAMAAVWEQMMARGIKPSDADVVINDLFRAVFIRVGGIFYNEQSGKRPR